ncbi:hypothetical protein TIFTF001_029814 [Ficus carica]|uniref:Secreted protein n=1 Tax=Ficus carica TaxID=3494 RepID=A0AA88J3A9_FICCA|nr:hypothetical protein TIFTF001_029814 [Ficus carica]
MFFLLLLLRFLFFRNSNHQNPITHRSLDLIDLGVLGQSKLPQEAATCSLPAVPLVFCLLLFFVPVCADVDNPPVTDFEVDVLFCEAWKIDLEDVGVRSFFPVHLGGGNGIP